MTALHGFLGRPGDWDGILEGWSRPSWLERGRLGCADVPGRVPRVQAEGSCGRYPCSRGSEETRVTGTVIPAPVAPFSPVTGDSYLDRLAQSLNETAEGEVLLGYSMGGRIALHMLVESGRWRQAIIVSASPGMSETPRHDEDTKSVTRAARLESDARWAERFLHDDWDAVVRDWNAQPVFAHDPPDRLPRREEDFDRRALAEALIEGSVARQADLREALKGIDLPILWIAGRKDPKYAALAEECAALNPLFEAKILDAGHRVPWGDPEGFRAAVHDFITIRP